MEQKIIDSLKDLLESKDDNNILLAANMMEDLDPDPSLFTHLYFHAQIRPKNEFETRYQSNVAQVIDKYFGEPLLQINDKDFYNVYDLQWSEEPEIYKDFEYLHQIPCIDMTTFCRLCMIYYAKGGAYAIHQELLTMPEVLPFYIKEDEIDLYKFGLDQFPMEVLDYPQITTLDLRDNPIETFPAEISQLSMLQEIFFDEEKISDESIKTLETSVPKAMAIYYCNEGVDLHHQDKHEEALVMGQKSFDLVPNDITNLNLLCGVYSSLGQNDKALDILLKAHAQDPNDLVVLSNLSILYDSLDQYAEALEFAEISISTYNRVGGLSPEDHASLYFNKAQALYHLDRLDESLKIYEKAVSIYPRCGVAHFNMACIYARWEDKDKMLGSLAEAIDCDEVYTKDAPKDTDFKAYWDDEDFIKLCEM